MTVLTEEQNPKRQRIGRAARRNVRVQEDAFTLKYFREAFISPETLDCEAFEQWKADGSKEIPQRTRTKAEDMLAHYHPPALNPARREELDAFVARRETEISFSLA